jgi:L,D-transpeptidase catalytic domain
MGTRGKHTAGKPAVWGWSSELVTVSVASAAAVIVVAYGAITHSASIRPATVSWASATQTLGRARKAANVVTVAALPSLPAKSAAPPPVPGPVALTARDYSLCPPAAAACVDLARHLTWLQSDGKVTFGPVQMEPGPPGSAHATPTGTFSVTWKGGPNVMSNVYNEPMPWAVFFGTDGIAFHEGSLTVPSHGCVHLAMANAHYYNEHLAIGAEVAVF